MVRVLLDPRQSLHFSRQIMGLLYPLRYFAAVAIVRESVPRQALTDKRGVTENPMRRFLIWAALALTAMTAGCQTTTPATSTPGWRFPCTYRAFDAGWCDNLNGL